jgi:hypothetical protein
MPLRGGVCALLLSGLKIKRASERVDENSTFRRVDGGRKLWAPRLCLSFSGVFPILTCAGVFCLELNDLGLLEKGIF